MPVYRDVIFGNSTIDSNSSARNISLRNTRKKLGTFPDSNKVLVCFFFFNAGSYEVYFQCTPHLKLWIAVFVFFFFFFPVAAFWKVILSIFIEVLKRNKATKLLKGYFKSMFVFTQEHLYIFFKSSFCISAYMQFLVVINFFCFPFSYGRWLLIPHLVWRASYLATNTIKINCTTC